MAGNKSPFFNCAELPLIEVAHVLMPLDDRMPFLLRLLSLCGVPFAAENEGYVAMKKVRKGFAVAEPIQPRADRNKPVSGEVGA